MDGGLGTFQKWFFRSKSLQFGRIACDQDLEMYCN